MSLGTREVKPSDLKLDGAPDHNLSQQDIERHVTALRRTVEEVERVVLGQANAVRHIVIALASGGHVLLEGLPGLGKTLLVRTIAQATGLDFSRVQFTPDLMPADITGSLVLQPDEAGRPHLAFQRGPVFSQIMLADEINRATPRTQSALLEAMQEHTISAGGTTHSLPAPFFVLATQNPIEMDGTYVLPEAQIDRFLLRVDLPYPDAEVLSEILAETTGAQTRLAQPVLTAEAIITIQGLVRSVVLADHVRAAVARFALMTQPSSKLAPSSVARFVRFGLSPRGAQSLVLAAKGHALLAGRYNVSFDDLRAMLLPTVRHRVHLNFEGRAENVRLEELLEEVLEASIGKAR